MPENPLLPNAQLGALHALLEQVLTHEKQLPRKKSSSGAAKTGSAVPVSRREALLAGTLLQLCAGDILVAEPADLLPAALLLSRAEEGGASNLSLSPGSPQLALATGLAEALQRGGTDRLVFVLLRTGMAEAEWASTLARAEEAKLPLIVACADPSGADTFRRTSQTAPDTRLSVSWSSVQKVASKSKLPVLSVDGEDAVAVYRVMQESVLRARSGGGPALIWAMLPTPAEARIQPRSALPLRRLERYLRTRHIAF